MADNLLWNLYGIAKSGVPKDTCFCVERSVRQER